MGDDSSVTAHGYRDVKQVTLVKHEELFCNLRRVLYVRDLKYSPQSIKATDRLGFKTEF